MHWSLEKLDGEALVDGKVEVEIPSQAALQVCAQDFSEYITEENIRKLVFITELYQGERLHSRQTAFFAPIKHLELEEPGIRLNAGEEDGTLNLELRATSMALLVEVALHGVDVVFSDNYFNLPAGRSVEICCPMPPGWTLDQATAALRIRSVYDSFAHGRET